MLRNVEELYQPGCKAVSRVEDKGLIMLNLIVMVFSSVNNCNIAFVEWFPCRFETVVDLICNGQPSGSL